MIIDKIRDRALRNWKAQTYLDKKKAARIQKYSEIAVVCVFISLVVFVSLVFVLVTY